MQHKAHIIKKGAVGFDAIKTSNDTNSTLFTKYGSIQTIYAVYSHNMKFAFCVNQIPFEWK